MINVAMANTLQGPVESLQPIFQVAFENSPLKLHAFANEVLEGVHDPLFTIVPVLHNFRRQYGHVPSYMIAELAFGLQLSSKHYVLTHTDHRDQGSGDRMVHTYESAFKWVMAISEEWMPRSDLTYFVRSNGDIEAYSGQIGQPEANDSPLFNRSAASLVVVAEGAPDSEDSLYN